MHIREKISAGMKKLTPEERGELKEILGNQPRLNSLLKKAFPIASRYMGDLTSPSARKSGARNPPRGLLNKYGKD
jgi:hypothetical protein